MAYLQSATSQGASSRFQTVTVPAGVTPAHVLYLHVGWVISVSAAVTVQTVTSNGAGTGSVVSAYPGTPNVNEGSALCKFTGATAGDVITVTTDVAKIWAIALHVFDTDLATFGTVYTRPANQTTTIPAAVTTTVGQKVFVFATERTTTVGTTVTVANANGRTVTQDFYSDLAGSSNCSFYLGEFVETGTSSGSTTLTYNNTGTNGMAIQATEVVTASAAVGTATLNLTGSGTAAPGGTGQTGTADLSLTGSLAASAVAAGSAALALSAAGSATPPVLTSATAGGVGTTTAKVRVDSTGATSATVTAATNTGLTTGVVTSGTVALDSDGLGIATLTGLTPGTDYFFGVTLGGAAQAARGNFRTAATGAHSFSFAAASCVATAGNPTVMQSIRTRTGPAGRTAEFFAHLGDFHYYSTLTTTAVYLTKYRNCLALSNYGALMSALPVEYTWSDHELGPDNCDAVVLGSTVIAAVRDVFNRYFPTYDLPASNTDTAPWRSWVRGRVRFIMTDGRTYMSDKNGTDNSSKTKLGTAQKAWIKAEVRAAKAAGQGIVWFHEDGGWTSTSTFANDDTWAAYTTERSELAADFTAAGVTGQMMIVHGDYHVLAADNGSNSPGGIPVVCASPMQQTYYVGASSVYSVGKYPTANPGGSIYQYGWFDVVDTGAATIQVNFTGYSNDNTGGTAADTSRMTMSTTLNTAQPSTGTAALSLTASGAGAGRATGAATVTLTAAATAASAAAGSAALSLTAAGPAAATVAGAASVSLTAAGASSTPAGAAAAVTLSAAGASSTPGVAAGSLTLTASATTRVAATATAALTLTAAASATSPAAGTGTIVLVASGNTSGSSAAAGTGALSLTGAASTTSAGSAAAVVTLTAAGSAKATAAGAASLAITVSSGASAGMAATGSLSLSGSGTAGSPGVVTGAAQLALTASAATRATTTASASLTLSSAVSAAARVSASAVVALSASGAAAPGAAGVAVVALAGTGSGSGAVSAGASLILSGTGSAGSPADGTGALSLTAFAASTATGAGAALLTILASGGSVTAGPVGEPVQDPVLTITTVGGTVTMTMVPGTLTSTTTAGNLTITTAAGR